MCSETCQPTPRLHIPNWHKFHEHNCLCLSWSSNFFFVCQMCKHNTSKATVTLRNTQCQVRMCVCVCSGSKFCPGCSQNVNKQYKLVQKWMMPAAAFCFASQQHTGEACDVWLSTIISHSYCMFWLKLELALSIGSAVRDAGSLSAPFHQPP